MRQLWPALATMAEIWIFATLVGFGYYGQNLNIGNYGQKRLLWLELGQLWAQNLFDLSFFKKKKEKEEEIIGGVVFVCRVNNDSAACHLDK
jgi:hypothetical protein